MDTVLPLSNEPVQDLPLPALREDLGLFAAPRNSRGEAGWSLHDPLRNRYFRLGEREFEMLTRWHEAAGIAALARRMTEAGIEVSGDDVHDFVEFLVRNELTCGDAGQGKRLYAAFRRRQQSWWQRLLHNYLFLRIPLVQPDSLLDRWYPVLRPLLSRRFAQITALVGLIGVFLVVRQWEIFVTTFMDFLNWQGALAFGVSLALVKVLHESGHALACRHFGLRVPTVGVVFIVMWPVMYTDATEAWRLTSRRARIVIASAGMLTELTIACYATLAWVLLPDGLLRSVVFTLATTTWIMSLAVNLNPLMKFDGYYLFSDILDIPNLQDRGFTLARNRLRHLLFGVPLVSDPGLQPGEQRIAIAWAYATWIYRFILFVGIAVLVYALFFKALGIFLFLVEIWWFIAAPIWREVRNWRALGQQMSSRRKRIALAGGAGLLLLLFVPWESSFTAQGVLKAERQWRIYPVEPAQVVAVHVQNGSEVHAGDVLFELESPELEADVARVRAQVAGFEFELYRVVASQDTASDRLVAEEALARARSALAGLEQRQQRQRVVASFSGTLVDVPHSLRRGLWVNDSFSLGVLVSRDSAAVVDAYITEDYLPFVRAGDAARFYADDPYMPALDGTVLQVDSVDARVLPEPYLASVLGGDIPVRSGPEGEALPEQAVYRVRVRLETVMADVPLRVSRGQLRLDGDDRSLALRFWTFLAGAVLRESGF
jgi:putative peptide zinc metalloprotease protein